MKAWVSLSELRRRRRRTRRQERSSRHRRIRRASDHKRHRSSKPVHPRDRYWFAAGEAYVQDGRRKHPRFPLPAPTHGGGSFYARYRAMYEAGFRAAKRGAS